MHVVVTKVRLKPDSVEACAELFRETNPYLVRDQPDWLGARMIVDRQENTVTVLASWRQLASYEALAQSEAFRAAMAKFAVHFASPPEITVNDVLVDMTPESVSSE